MSEWKEYISKTSMKPPSELLKKAVKETSDKELALDLGPGAFKDTKFLLSSGFKKVIAVDIADEGLEHIKDLIPAKVEFVNTSFDKFRFSDHKFDLINAQFSLPFNSPSTFKVMFENLKSSLKPDGIFAGQFFGIRDKWNNGKNDLTFHTLTEILIMMRGMEIIELKEDEEDRAPVIGDIKHWHVYHIIASKMSSVPEEDSGSEN
ncbi:class I SAM-dependent methyltransferase [soil metagenome]